MRAENTDWYDAICSREKAADSAAFSTGKAVTLRPYGVI